MSARTAAGGLVSNPEGHLLDSDSLYGDGLGNEAQQWGFPFCSPRYDNHEHGVANGFCILCKACLRRRAQVIAIDASFCLFQRAWCIAELVEAHKNMIPQHLKVFSRSKLYGTEEQLRDLRVQDMKATRSEDVDEILCKIPDKDAFNQFLQHLIFDTGGLLDQWHRGDASQQMGGVGRLLKWSRSGFDIWPLWEY